MKEKPLTLALNFVFLAVLVYIVWDSGEEKEPLDLSELVDTWVDEGMRLSSESDDSDLLKARTLVLTSDVNANSSRAIVTKLLLLEKRAPGEPVDFYMKTFGGWESDAYAIIDVIRSMTSPVNVHALGSVSSSGVMILAAGTGERVVYENTILGFHSLDEGGSNQDKLSDERYVRYFKENGKFPDDWLTRTDDKMLYFTPDEALEYGVADRVQRAGNSLPREMEE